MINFFRRIRQKFLADGSISKYLLYAIGEIILVVIGILIALQINNFNQNQKDAKLEQQYLVALQEEFLLNMDKLKVLDTLLGVQLDAVEELIQNAHPTTVNLDDLRLASLINEGFRDTYYYFPSSGVMKDLINSGKLSLISNPKLRRILADWDSNITQLKEFEMEAKNASEQVVEILRTNGNFRTQLDLAFKALGTGPSLFQKSNSDLLQLEVFENSITYFSAITWRLKNVIYPELKDKMEVVLTTIELEIN